MNRPDDRPFNPLLFRLYASDLSEAIYQMIDRDKLRHEYPGGLRTRVIGSHKFVTLGDKTVMVSQMATDEEIAAALHLNGGSAPVPATPLPPAPTIEQAPAVAPVRKPVAPGSFAASLKAIVDEAKAGIEQTKADGLAKVREAVGDLTKAKDATIRVTDNMANTVKSQAADIMAELGQISNDL